MPSYRPRGRQADSRSRHHRVGRFPQRHHSPSRTAAGGGGEHAALVRELGATPIDYQREDFARVLPGGFDVIFDGIG